MDSSTAEFKTAGAGDAEEINRKRTALSRTSDCSVGDGLSNNLLKLRGISEDECSENALLRSRIDEQSQLIMILKRRADEATESARMLQKQKSSLELENQQLSECIQLHVRRCNMLEARFNDLASNHQQMIEFKDEYKKKNAELQAENDLLRSQNSQLFSDSVQERDNKIAVLEKLEAEKNEEIKMLADQCRKSQETRSQLTEQYELELNGIRKKLSYADKCLEDTRTELQNLILSTSETNLQTQIQIQKLKKDKEELLELAMSRGRLIQEKQVENSQLQKKAENIEKAMKDLQAKYARDTAAVGIDQEVQRLQRCLIESYAANESIAREYETFKKHSQSLLQQEKELNERLRHFVT
jgi:myosin heavy subunit